MAGYNNAEHLNERYKLNKLVSQFEGLIKCKVGDYKNMEATFKVDKSKTPYHAKLYHIPIVEFLVHDNGRYFGPHWELHPGFLLGTASTNDMPPLHLMDRSYTFHMDHMRCDCHFILYLVTPLKGGVMTRRFISA